MGKIQSLFIFILLNALFSTFSSGGVNGIKTRKYEVKLSTKDDVHCKLSKRFLSVGLNAELLQKKWYGVDFGSQRMKTLLAGLKPAYLRLSGKAANHLLFNPQVEGIQQNTMSPQLMAQTFTTLPPVPVGEWTTVTPIPFQTAPVFNASQMQQTPSYLVTPPPAMMNDITTPPQGQYAETTTPAVYNAAQAAVTESTTAAYPTQQPQAPYQQQQQPQQQQQQPQQQQQQQQQPYPTQQTTQPQQQQQQTTQPQQQQQQQQTTQPQQQQQQTTQPQQQQGQQDQQQQDQQNQQQQPEAQQSNNDFNQAPNGEQQLPNTAPPGGVNGAPTPPPYKKGKKKKDDKRKKSSKKGKGKKQRESRQVNENERNVYTWRSDEEDDENEMDSSGDDGSGEKRQDESVFQYSAAMFDKLVMFCQETGLQLIFALNEFTREQDNSLSTNNANELIQHAIGRGFNIDWELGNEPDTYNEQSEGKKISAETVGQDFAKLRAILDGASNGKAMLYGPDVSSTPKSLSFLKDFLKEGHAAVNAITWHHYYKGSQNPNIQDFLNPDLLESFRQAVQSVQEVVKTTKTPLWIGESGDFTSDGVEDLSNSYVAGFMFLDKLGQAAMYCNAVVIKNGIIGGSNAMLGKDYEPNPLYWISFMYKQLVGRRVLNVGGEDKLVRVYAHCAERSRLSLPKGSVVIYVLNMQPKATTSLSFMNYGGKNVDEYLLTAPKGDLKSQSIDLNGQTMRMDDDNSLPKIIAQKRKAKAVIPPLAYGFFVIKDAKHPLC